MTNLPQTNQQAKIAHASHFNSTMVSMVERIKHDDKGQAVGMRIHKAIEAGVNPKEFEALILRRAGNPISKVEECDGNVGRHVLGMIHGITAAFGIQADGNISMIVKLVQFGIAQRFPHLTVEELGGVALALMSVPREKRPNHYGRLSADYVLDCIEIYMRIWQRRAGVCHQILRQHAPLALPGEVEVTDPRIAPEEEVADEFPEGTREKAMALFEKWEKRTESAMFRIKRAATEADVVPYFMDVAKYVYRRFDILSEKEVEKASSMAMHRCFVDCKDNPEMFERITKREHDEEATRFFGFRYHAEFAAMVFDKWLKSGQGFPE